jgi:glutamyl-tRNA reductase
MIVMTGLSHVKAPLELRERCAVPAEERDTARAEITRRLGPAVLLSTCGRIDVYVDVADSDRAGATAQLRAWLAQRAGVSTSAIGTYVETLAGEAAVRRIVRVACGLESALEGEDEILGQVRRSWLDAGLAGTLSPALDAAFRLAVRTGRQVRRFGSREAWTSLAETAAAHVALALSERTVPRVLIAGSGPMGMRAALALRSRFGDGLEMAIAGRTPERVTVHAAEAAAQPLTLAGIPPALAWADAAVVGLRTRTPLIDASQIAPRPPERPLLIVDLSLPRAVAPDAGMVQGVSLRDIDHLAGAERGHARWDREDRARIERLVERALRDHAALTHRTDAATTLAALRIQADGIRRSQLDRTLRRLPYLDADARWVVDALTRAIVNRILHEPTMRLKRDDGDAITAQVRQTFGLE